jgi:cytochrome P450
MPPLIPEDIDPPMHGQYRKVLTSALGPTAIARKEAEYRGLADQLLGAIPAEGEFDFCAAFSAQFPERVALRTIGFDEQDRRDLARWFHDLTHLRGIDEQAAINAAMAMFGRVAEVIAQRRGEPRRDDLLSAMLDGTVGDNGDESAQRPLTDQEVLMYVALLLFGGLDTTASAISGAFYYLARHSADRARLLSDDIALDRAVEEFVRWTTPVQGLGRTVTEDTTLGGCPLHAGDRVMLLWGSGNRDESVFERPDEIVLNRFPNRHLGFGMGPHRCMGSHLAKVMVKIAIEQGLPALGDFELADPTRVRWAAGEARGIVELPLRKH